MEVEGHGDSLALRNVTGNEADLLRFAINARARRIAWFDLPHRGLKNDLDLFSSELSAGLLSRPRSEGGTVSLGHRETDLAIQSMRWVLAHRDFDPQHTTGEVRQLLKTIPEDAA